jgi:hypothetical protein
MAEHIARLCLPLKENDSMSETFFDDVDEAIPRTMTIEVSPPAVFDKTTYGVITLGVPTLADYQFAQRSLKNTATSSTEFMAQLISRASGVPADAIKMLDADIVMTMFAFVSTFINPEPVKAKQIERRRTIEVREIQAAGQSLTLLDLRPPTLSEYQQSQAYLKETPESATELVAQLLQRVSGWPLAAIKMLDVDVALEAFDFVSGFTEPPRKAGSGSN